VYDLEVWGLKYRSRRFHPQVRQFVASPTALPESNIFRPRTDWLLRLRNAALFHTLLRLTQAKGFDVFGVFARHTLDTFGLIGGYGRSRPNASALER